jgi:hypothetical protein
MNRIGAALIASSVATSSLLIASPVHAFVSVKRTGINSVSCPWKYSVMSGGVGTLPRDTFVRDSSTRTTSTKYSVATSQPTSTGWHATGLRTQTKYDSLSGKTYVAKFSFAPAVYVICGK